MKENFIYFLNSSFVYINIKMELEMEIFLLAFFFFNKQKLFLFHIFAINGINIHVYLVDMLLLENIKYVLCVLIYMVP